MSEVTVDDVKDENKGVEVELQKKKAEEPKYVTMESLEEIRKQVNGLSSVMRHVKDIPSQIEELKRSVAANRSMTSGEKREAVDDLDTMLEQGNWRTPVETITEKKINEILRRREEQEFVRQSEANKITILEQNKKFVRERYPDIDDPESEIAKKYIEVLNENPHYLKNEFGPKLAMRDMEDKLREEGRLDEFTKKAVDKEIQRQARTKMTSVTNGSPSGKGGKIVLTREQKEICDSSGIPYERYALMLKKQQGEGRNQVEA